jgi:LacI family fructose operon transcriptional repressor
MVKIKDVADAAGVSTATVSRVLANKPYVSKKVQKRVLEVVQTLGYRPNRVARNLRARQSSIIALIVSDIQNPFFQMVSRAVEDTAYEQGFSVMLCNNDENPDKEKMYLNLMHDENVAGIIFSPTRQTADNFQQINELNTPMVVIDRRVKSVSVDNIMIDNIESAHEIVSHLIEHGYRRIGAVFGIGSTTGRERYKGYATALKDHGIEPKPELAKYVNARESDGYATVARILKLNPPPDAIFTSNGLLAAGALRAILDSKRAIPDEIAFASFDDTPWSRLVVPAITVIEQPTYEIGQLATELLLKRLKDPDRSSRTITLKGKLVLRQSCGCK